MARKIEATSKKEPPTVSALFLRDMSKKAPTFREEMNCERLI